MSLMTKIKEFFKGKNESNKQSDLKKELEKMREQVEDLKNQVEDLDNRNQDLTSKMEATTKLRPMVKIEDLTTHFKEVITKLNRQPPTDGENYVILEQLEAEIKGGLDVKDGIQLSQVLPHELTPQNISSIRFTLRPTSVIKIVKE